MKTTRSTPCPSSGRSKVSEEFLAVHEMTFCAYGEAWREKTLCPIDDVSGRDLNPCVCHFDHREKSFPLSERSVHSGLRLFTKASFFSLRHFLISFSLANALCTSLVCSK